MHGCCAKEHASIGWGFSLEGMAINGAGIPRRSWRVGNASRNRVSLYEVGFAGIFWSGRGDQVFKDACQPPDLSACEEDEAVGR